MAQRVSRALLKRETRTATETSATMDLTNDPLHRAILTLKVYSGGDTGTSPTLDVKIQGAPQDESALFTAVRAFAGPIRSHTSPGFATFAQATTAVTQLKFADYLPRYLRAVATLAGSSPSFNCVVWVDGETG